MTEQNNPPNANFGFVGLGVMGRMLALNMQRHGFRVAGYDLDPEKVRAFAAPGNEQSDLPALIPCPTMAEFLQFSSDRAASC
jgi:6-phosphogluconate dehydrogenase